MKSTVGFAYPSSVLVPAYQIHHQLNHTNWMCVRLCTLNGIATGMQVHCAVCTIAAQQSPTQIVGFGTDLAIVLASNKKFDIL